MLYDVLIIGGGPAGYTAAEKAAANGLKVLLAEKNALGGTCLHEGCIPTKTLLYSAKLLDTLHTSSKYGISVENPSFDLPKILIRKNKIIKKLHAGIRQRMQKHQIDVIADTAVISKHEDVFSIVCGEQSYKGKHLLLCAGSLPVIPSIPGLDELDCWTSREALQPDNLPEHLLVIGGGVIGMEFASLFTSLGVKVSVIEMQEEILPNFDTDVAKMLRNSLEKKGVSFYLSCKVTSVDKENVHLQQASGECLALSSGKILLSIGRKPNMEGLGLELLSLKKTQQNTVFVDENMQTSFPGVYACGDIIGTSMLAHSATREAEVAINHILGKDDRMSYKAIPSVVYTNPEIASVGCTENMLQKQKINYQVLQLPMSYSGRFVIENEGQMGLCKILVDEQQMIQGVHLCGNPSSEFISVATMAIETKMTTEQFLKIVLPHPTVHEILKETLN